MSKWTPVIDMDLDNGEHTCYSREISKSKYIWLTQMADGCWNVEIKSPDGDLTVLAKSTTLGGAKQRALKFIKDKL